MEGWDPVNRFDHIDWMAAVTPTDLPKSVRNHYVIEVLGCVLVFTNLSLGERACVIGFC